MTAANLAPPIHGVPAPTRHASLFGTGVHASQDPRQSWTDKAGYDRAAEELVARFEANFAAFEAGVDDYVRAAAIRAAA